MEVDRPEIKKRMVWKANMDGLGRSKKWNWTVRKARSGRPKMLKMNGINIGTEK